MFATQNTSPQFLQGQNDALAWVRDDSPDLDMVCAITNAQGAGPLRTTVALAETTAIVTEQYARGFAAALTSYLDVVMRVSSSLRMAIGMEG